MTSSGEVDQIIHLPSYDALSVPLLRLPVLAMVQQKAGADLPLSLMRSPQIPFELGIRHGCNALCPVGYFSIGNSQVGQAGESVLAGNAFWTTVQPGDFCEEFPEFPFGTQPQFCTT